MESNFIIFGGSYGPHSPEHLIVNCVGILVNLSDSWIFVYCPLFELDADNDVQISSGYGITSLPIGVDVIRICRSLLEIGDVSVSAPCEPIESILKFRSGIDHISNKIGNSDFLRSFDRIEFDTTVGSIQIRRKNEGTLEISIPLELR